MHTNKTYEFSNFQELFEVVPANRIKDCLDEIGTLLASSKEYVELIEKTAQELAKDDNISLDGIIKIVVPEKFHWTDDGKKEIGADFELEGKEFSKIKFKGWT